MSDLLGSIKAAIEAQPVDGVSVSGDYSRYVHSHQIGVVKGLKKSLFILAEIKTDKGLK
jgi:hypothetical protein